MPVRHVCWDCGSTNVMLASPKEIAERFGHGVPAPEPVHHNGHSNGAVAQAVVQEAEKLIKPTCPKCGTGKLGQKRDGSWFGICFDCERKSK